MGYQYRGTVHDLDEPIILEPDGQFDPSNCGTISAYKRHLKHGVPACQPCRDAKREQSRRDYARTRANRERKFDPSACGTYAGYRRHARSSVPNCAACLNAYADYMRDYREKRKEGTSDHQGPTTVRQV